MPGSLLAVPRAGLHLADSLRRGAIENARVAALAISDSLVVRHALAPADEAAPGALTRLTEAECLALLDTRHVGRLAYVARAGVPDVVPVNYALVDGDVLLRSGPGPKLQAAERREVVAFEVDDLDEQGRTGWSVVVHGRAVRLGPDEHRRLPEGALPETWASGPRWAVVRIRPTRIAGRRLH